MRFEERGGAIARPDDPAKYIIEFGDRLVAHLECLDGSSTWTASGGDLRVGKLEGARKGCAHGSMSDRLVNDWKEIRSYSVRSGSLYLALKNGRGWYVFEPYSTSMSSSVLERLKRYTESASASSVASTSSIAFDAKGVDFGPWIRRFVAQLKQNWYARIPQTAMAIRGHSVIAFDVYKDGRLTDVQLVVPSSVESFNDAARDALVATTPTEPLPAAYPSEKAHFTITFYYNEKPPDTPAPVSPQ